MPLTRREFNKMVAVVVATGATIGISSRSVARRIWKRVRAKPLTIAAVAGVFTPTVVGTGDAPIGLYPDLYSVAYG